MRMKPTEQLDHHETCDNPGGEKAGASSADRKYEARENQYAVNRGSGSEWRTVLRREREERKDLTGALHRHRLRRHGRRPPRGFEHHGPPRQIREPERERERRAPDQEPAGRAP